MKRMCAWCGLAMGLIEPLDREAITHGICLTCGTEMLAGIRQTRRGGEGGPSTLPTETPRESAPSQGRPLHGPHSRHSFPTSPTLTPNVIE